MIALFAFIVAAFAKPDFDHCTDPLIVTGSTMIYLQDMKERQVIEGWKGMFVEFHPGEHSEGYHFYTLSEHPVAVIEVVQCDHSNAYNALPWDMMLEANSTRMFFFAVKEDVNDDIVIVVERMLYSEDINNPVVIREEFFPLTVKTHGDLQTGKIYYKIIGRTNWRVDLYIDGTYKETHDVKQYEEEIVTVEIKDVGIHEIKFDYAQDVAQFQDIVVDTYQPSVLNAIFRVNGVAEKSTCFTDERRIVGYKGKATGYLTLTDKISGVAHKKYLNTNGKCIEVETGKAYYVDGEYEIILSVNMFVTNDVSVIFTVGLSTGSEPQPEPTPDTPTSESKEEEGLSDEVIIAISVVGGIVGILMLIAVILLIFIIYKKCTKKGDYQQLD